MSIDPDATQPRSTARIWRYEFEELGRALDDLESRARRVGAINPRPAGVHNNFVQLFKKLLGRILGWYTRPSVEFNAAIATSLREIQRALDDVAAYTYSLDWRLGQLEMTAAALGQETNRDYRTTYVVGLFGSGRQYVSGLILQNMGQRARYFRDAICLHPGPTPMVYSGHATLKYASRAQYLPEVTGRIVEGARRRIADLIFIYRHPLDSLLTNWLWWRTYIRQNRKISGISEVFDGKENLCAYLEQNFPNFMAFAEGDPAFFAGLPGARFLSFREFVEETELYLQAATLTLRFEDFAMDPEKEFSKVAELMSVPVPLGSRLEPPRSKPYGYLDVKKRVPRFRSFIDALDVDTKGRIEQMGYSLEE